LIEKKIKKWVLFLFFIFIFSSSGWVLCYRFIDPPFSSLMLIRYFEKNTPSSVYNLRSFWTPLSQISPQLKLAVLIGEDFFFYSHPGLNFSILKEAVENAFNKVPIPPTSTITQQLAKNLFLYPKKTYLRKALELYFALLMELFLSKDRILEIYLNTIEWGPGIFGIRKASEHFFSLSPSELYFNESCLLVGAMPFAKFIDKPLKQFDRAVYRSEALYEAGKKLAFDMDRNRLKRMDPRAFLQKPKQSF
jgi:monofunctional biosynthetic peptidoglycan transglycosylase